MDRDDPAARMTPDSLPARGPSRCLTCPLGIASGTREGRRCTFAPKERAAGVLLYLEGDDAERIWYVVNGQVTLSRELGDTRGAVTWAVRQPGDLLGAEALIGGTYRDSARTLSSTTLCSASLESVEGWLGPAGSPARALLLLSLRMHASEAPRLSGADGRAPQRVARWLLDSARDGAAPPTPRRVVAGLLGMLPETFSRALAQLVRAGAIKVDRKAIRVIDEGALLRAAGEDEDDL